MVQTRLGHAPMPQPDVLSALHCEATHGLEPNAHCQQQQQCTVLPCTLEVVLHLVKYLLG
jgi:hypothetical protein